MDFTKWFKKYEKVIGTVASILSILMFVALIEFFISNIQGKSDLLIQPLATALNCLLWSTYAYGRKDYFLLIPNILGLVLGVMTVISAII